MNEPKFTPGPWVVHPFLAKIDAFLDSDGALTPEPIPICGMLWPTDKRSEDETEANAALIAAAPELYAENQRLRAVNGELCAALEAFLEWVQSPLAHSEGERAEIAVKVMAYAIAALAKARGGHDGLFTDIRFGSIIGCHVGWVATVRWERRILADLIADSERQRRDFDDLMRDLCK